MISNITKKAFYHILKEAVEKGENVPNLTADELVEELSIRLGEMLKEDH